MSDGPVVATPNEELAVIVVRALVDAQLVASSRQADAVKKLMAGTAKAEDWNRWIEEALDAISKRG